MIEATASVPDGIRLRAPLSVCRSRKYFEYLGFCQSRSDLSRHHVTSLFIAMQEKLRRHYRRAKTITLILDNYIIH
ncbi:hypothetical protein BJP24_15380 [Aeromonas allosaccharophila]|nr:hypothetical protein BJP24_15380 [Aeromonas allosaccharophila]